MKRIKKTRKERNIILILTNGKQTEKNYFNCLKISYKSMFVIKVEYKNCECDKLVEHAKSYDLKNYNQIWCVFDIDETYNENHLLNAIENAKKNNIQVAFSNEAFEVWLLFHLTNQVNRALTRKTYTKELNKRLKQIGVEAIYKKNDQELLKSVFMPKVLDATQNAKKAYQRLEAEHQRQFMGNKGYPIWEWKSVSTVYQLIDALHLTPSESVIKEENE